MESCSCRMACFLNVCGGVSKFPMFSPGFYDPICFKHLSSFFPFLFPFSFFPFPFCFPFLFLFLPDFGELSKKLAEVWKQLPEKDKLVSVCVRCFCKIISVN